MEKCLLKNGFYKKIFQSYIQVLNFVHCEQCQAVMSWIFTGNMAADTVSCLRLLVCVPMLLGLLSLTGNQTGSETAFCCCCQATFLAVSVSQPDAVHDYPTNHAIVRERYCRDGTDQDWEGQGLLRQCCSTILRHFIYSRATTCCMLKMRLGCVLRISCVIVQTEGLLLQKKLQKKALLYL